MARAINKLTPKTVAALNATGYYGDGAGLWLQVSKWGTKTWVFRYTRQGRTHEMGLGPLHTVSLAEARIKASAARKGLLEGVDPVAERRARITKAQAASAKSMTFSECAKAYIEAKSPEWKNAKHIAQWSSTLEAYAYPVFGRLPVSEVDTALVVKVLGPIWEIKTETATRLRGRIEKILDWATTSKFRHGDNPARWKGHLENLLANPNKVAKVEHHAAMGYAEVGSFIAGLHEQEGIAARALEFCILTATRTNETLLATWTEIDLAAKVWTIPGERMKAGREHRVPLSDRAVAILTAMQETKLNDYVFPGAREGRPMSNMAMTMVLRRMGHGGLTVHGFRSTFRDWAAERTNYPREVAEMALAHAIADKTEAAYRRGDLFEKRRRMMGDWARYCATLARGSAEVVPMRARVS